MCESFASAEALCRAGIFDARNRIAEKHEANDPSRDVRHGCSKLKVRETGSTRLCSCLYCIRFLIVLHLEMAHGRRITTRRTERLLNMSDSASTSEEVPADKVVVSPDLSYWEQSRQPLASLFFILPFLVIYEVGVLLQAPGSPRSGAEVWLRQLLSLVSLGKYYFLLPLLIVVILLGWHHVTAHRWKITKNLLIGMFVESLFLAVVLIMIAKLQNSWYPFSIGDDLRRWSVILVPAFMRSFFFG